MTRPEYRWGRCPYCGRFVENDAQGYYANTDLETDPELSDVETLRVFCAEPCYLRFKARAALAKATEGRGE